MNKLTPEAMAYLEEAMSVSERNSTTAKGDDVNYEGESVVEEMAPWYEALWVRFGRTEALDDFNSAAAAAWSLFERHTKASRKEFSAAKGNALGRWRRRMNQAQPGEVFSGDRPKEVTDIGLEFAKRTRRDDRIPWDTAERFAIGRRAVGIEQFGPLSPKLSQKEVRESHPSVHASLLIESYEERMDRLENGVSSMKEPDDAWVKSGYPKPVHDCRWCKP